MPIYNDEHVAWIGEGEFWYVPKVPLDPGGLPAALVAGSIKVAFDQSGIFQWRVGENNALYFRDKGIADSTGVTLTLQYWGWNDPDPTKPQLQGQPVDWLDKFTLTAKFRVIDREDQFGPQVGEPVYAPDDPDPPAPPVWND